MSASEPTRFWPVGPDRVLSLEPFVLMGVVNMTPDSFSDGGRFASVDEALAHALQLVDEGAGIIDVGGESTRPGAEPVAADEQIRRVVPLIARLRGRSNVAISIDTTSAAVANAALEAGADIVNDVSAGADDSGMFPLVAKRGAGLILMHRLVAPGQDSYSDRYSKEPSYGDVVREVCDFLVERRSDPEQRIIGSVVAAVAAYGGGARIVRAHDVGAHREALLVAHAVLRGAGLD